MNQEPKELCSNCGKNIREEWLAQAKDYESNGGFVFPFENYLHICVRNPQEPKRCEHDKGSIWERLMNNARGYETASKLEHKICPFCITKKPEQTGDSLKTPEEIAKESPERIAIKIMGNVETIPCPKCSPVNDGCAWCDGFGKIYTATGAKIIKAITQAISAERNANLEKIRELEKSLSIALSVPEQEFEEVKTIILRILADASLKGFAVKETEAVKAFDRGITFVNRKMAKVAELESKLAEAEARITRLISSPMMPTEEVVARNKYLETEIDAYRLTVTRSEHDRAEYIIKLEKKLAKLESEAKAVRSALKEAYCENQNMQCYVTKGSLNECLERQTKILREALKESGK